MAADRAPWPRLWLLLVLCAVLVSSQEETTLGSDVIEPPQEVPTLGTDVIEPLEEVTTLGADVIEFPDDSTTPEPDDKPSTRSAICSQRGCTCHKRRAVCRCETKKLELSAEHFAGDDIVELHVLGALCLRVTVESNTFHKSSVKRVKMEGIRKVMLQGNSFRIKPTHQLTVDFENVQELLLKSHSFSGGISVTFANSSLKVPDKTFVGVAGPTSAVVFVNSTVELLGGQAFAFSRPHRLELRECDLRKLEADSLDVEDVHTLVVQGCTFGEMPQDALAVRWSGAAHISNNTFTYVPGGTFYRLRAGEASARLEFHDNWLQRLEASSLPLKFSEDLAPEQVSVQRLHVPRQCRCDLDTWVRRATGDEAADWLVLRLVSALHCLSADGDDMALLSYLGRHCRSDDVPPAPPAEPISWRRYLVVGAVTAALIAVLCAVTCFALWRRSRQREEQHRDRAASAALHHRPHKLNNANLYSDAADSESGWSEAPPESPRRPLVVAVPDVKTYTETELQVVLETLESLEPSTLPRTPSGTLHRQLSSAGGPPQSPGCRKSCPL